MIAANHNINQMFIGIMFACYSVTMAIFSPIVGKYQNGFGRRNMCRWGMMVASLPFFGFFINNYTENSNMFIFVFMALRMLQGIGTSMVQTAILSILTLAYPTKVNFVAGCVEIAAGVGLSVGPVLGSILYEFGGISAPFSIFFVILTFIGIIIKSIIPQSADSTFE